MKIRIHFIDGDIMNASIDSTMEGLMYKTDLYRLVTFTVCDNDCDKKTQIAICLNNVKYIEEI